MKSIYQYNLDTVYDFIWNITLVCPWNCEFCCTDSVHVTKVGGEDVIFEKGLNYKSIIKNASKYEENFMTQKILSDGLKVNKFDLALIDRQNRNVEILYEEKLALLNNLGKTKVCIDFAGGDPLSCYENFLIIKAASEKFGKESISITSTGFSINRYGVETVANTIGEFEFTFDENSHKPPTHRPDGYNASNLKFAEKFARLGVKTKAQLPIHDGNISSDVIKSIYLSLTAANIDELLLMRTFPVGRGMTFISRNGMYKQDDYRKAIELYRSLENKHGGPRVRLQCALKHLENTNFEKNPCDLMRESYGINAKGNLLLSAWATNSQGDPLSDDFVLGNLHQMPFKEILSTPKAKRYFAKLDDNFGHCKIFAYVMSKTRTEEDIFRKNDPLFATDN